MWFIATILYRAYREAHPGCHFQLGDLLGIPATIHAFCVKCKLADPQIMWTCLDDMQTSNVLEFAFMCLQVKIENLLYLEMKLMTRNIDGPRPIDKRELTPWAIVRFMKNLELVSTSSTLTLMNIVKY